jgi:hypothetical protein
MHRRFLERAQDREDYSRNQRNKRNELSHRYAKARAAWMGHEKVQTKPHGRIRDQDYRQGPSCAPAADENGLGH